MQKKIFESFVLKFILFFKKNGDKNMFASLQSPAWSDLPPTLRAETSRRLAAAAAAVAAALPAAAGWTGGGEAGSAPGGAAVTTRNICEFFPTEK